MTSGYQPLFVLHGHIARQYVRIIYELFHVRMPGPVIQYQTPHQPNVLTYMVDALILMFKVHVLAPEI